MEEYNGMPATYGDIMKVRAEVEELDAKFDGSYSRPIATIWFFIIGILVVHILATQILWRTLGTQNDKIAELQTQIITLERTIAEQEAQQEYSSSFQGNVIVSGVNDDSEAGKYSHKSERRPTKIKKED